MFGGTFNPPHNAHRLMLEAAADSRNFDKILIIPTNIPPHKEVASYCPDKEHRLNMCKLLAQGVENAVVSDNSEFHFISLNCFSIFSYLLLIYLSFSMLSY